MPDLSVVIPTYRRPVQLSRTLEALARQTAAPESFEVIVVDNDASAAPRAEPGVRWLRESRKGASAARNAGWRAARAPVVLFLGDDILAGRELVELHLTFHARCPEDTAGLLGHVRWAEELRPTTFMRWLERGFQSDYGRLDGGEAPWWGDFTTSQVSVKRSLLERAGGFDEERFPFLYEDTELGYRLHQLGLRLHYEPRARSEHLHRPDLEEWRERMSVVAAAERRFSELHGEPQWFAARMREAMAAPPPRPRLAQALRPLGGRARAWAEHQLDVHHRRQLAPAFLAAWDAASGAEAVDDARRRPDGEAVGRDVPRHD